MKFTCLTVLTFLAATAFPSLAQTTAATKSCQPSGCAAQCPSGCSSDQICALGTMSSCGVCPDSVCVSRAVLGLPTSSNTSSNASPSGTLIGGIVGGVLGAGLLIGLAFAGRRFLQKKKRQALRNALSVTPTTAPSSSSIHTSISLPESRTMATRHAMSGAIPITFIPSDHTQYPLPVENHAPLSTDDPFSDIHSQYDDSRQSYASSMTQTTPAKMSFATQITRVKPQMMQIAALRRNNSNRSDVTKKSETGGLSEKDTENPFDDSQGGSSQSSSPSPSRPITGSLEPATGDGEITVFWSGQNK